MPRAKTRRLRRVEKLIFCPDCGRRFSDETNLLRHINQPSNTCGSSIRADSPVFQVDRDIPVQAAINSPRQVHSHPDSPPSLGTRLDDLDDHAFQDFDMDLFPDGPDPNPDDDDCVEYHPRTSPAFPGGKTFMDHFFADQYASLRRENVFYPFASQEDWQIGSWLLRSGLSMAAIDTFLSLNLASFHSIYTYHLIRDDT